ncbi:MAG TPA: DUF4153 domain-containing protein [Catenuloplanes sp.]
MLGGALAAGTATAASVPLDRPGVGWLIPAVVAAGGVVVVARSAGTRWDGTRIAWGLVTIALIGSGAVRAAGWLFVLCLLTATVTGSLAVAGGRSARGLALGAAAWPGAAARAVPWLVRGAMARRTGGPAAVRVLLTAASTALLLVVFGALFASADPQFARIVAAVLPEISAEALSRWVTLFVIGVVGLAGAAYLISAPPDLTGLEGPGIRRLARLEWLLPVGALDLLFGLFVAVQFAGLFGGTRHVLAPGGPSFAEYARRGFWQLLMVTVLTLVVLAGVARWARRDGRTDRIVLRAALGTLAILALVVVGTGGGGLGAAPDARLRAGVRLHPAPVSDLLV